MNDSVNSYICRYVVHIVLECLSLHFRKIDMNEFREQFDNARIALVQAKQIKKEFDTLFYNESNQEIVRSTASTFFELVYAEFRESLIVKLCKLTDPKTQGNNANLSAEHILNCTPVTEAANFNTIKNIYDKRIVPYRRALIRYRNKYAVHSDLTTLLSDEERKPSDKVIMDLYDAVNDFYNEVSISVFKITLSDDFYGYKNGADYLMHLLKNKV